MLNQIVLCKLAIEYQGEGHYNEMEFWGGKEALVGQQERDAEKKLACSTNNIRLIEIDYTWDGNIKKIVNLLSV